jgi:DNA-binding winged helix-turn-helix (wHTH) protein
MNGFIDLGEEFVPLTPQELAILKALYSEPYEPIGDLSLLDRLGSNAQLSILKVLVGELNKKIVGGREGIRSPIRRTKEVGYCFEDPLFRIDRNKPSAHSVPRLEPRIQAIEKRAVEANVNAEKEEGEHAHWWLIDEAEGHMSEGICKKCGDRQLFVNTPEYIVNRDEKY